MDKERLLYQYFSNSLTPEQEVEFNTLLSVDKGFKEQFDFEQSLQKVIKNKEGKDLKDKLKGFETNIKKDATPVIKLNFRKWAMAASIALIIGIGWFTYNNMGANYDDLYNSNFEQYPNTVFSITRGDTVASLEREAFVAYETEKYTISIENFEKISKEERKPYVDFYLALSYLNSKKNVEAKKYFKKTIAKDDVFVAESHWYLAMIALKEKDKAIAKSELKKLTDNYSYNKQKALSLLKELN